ncbi:MAG: hypothetical protein FWH24_01030 [Oscillospiraceae bacterium]|nr:hypothetical protein [Oscillospiraceae bacterium]
MNDSAPKARKKWYRLDNAAKIFPPTSSKSDTKVFRFACELRENIDEETLQTALNQTLDDFPGFRYILKHGMFWYYLEQSYIRPVVREETAPPCSTVYLGRKALLFEVTWYKKRINLEVYHALTDGTGAMQFLKALVTYYLKTAHPDVMASVVNIDYETSETQQMTDSFDKYYDKSKEADSLKNPAAYQIKGVKQTEWRLKIIEGNVPTEAILNTAREFGATATVFVTALFMRAIYGEMSVNDRKKPVVISIPVNLRNYFASESARNFFSLVDIKYDFKNNSGTLEDIIKHAKECLSEHLNEEYLQARLNKFLSFERNYFVRLVPLAIKNLYMSAAYSAAAREVTASVSNVGRVIMPGEAREYIELFDVFTSTEKLQICICSYEDNMNISFTSPFVSTDIQRSFFRQLTQMGIPVKISANE